MRSKRLPIQNIQTKVLLAYCPQSQTLANDVKNGTLSSVKNELKKSTIPEILRSNITSVVLNLKKLGIDDLVHFDFIDPPAPETMMRALEMLNYLGAIDDEGNLTELGSNMNQLPLEPELSKMVLSGVKYKCINEILTIASLMSVQNPFLRPRGKEAKADEEKSKFTSHLGDHFTILIAYNNYIRGLSESENYYILIKYGDINKLNIPISFCSVKPEKDGYVGGGGTHTISISNFKILEE